MAKNGLTNYGLFKRPVETTTGEVLLGKFRGGSEGTNGIFVDGKTLATPMGVKVAEEPWLLHGTYYSIPDALSAARPLVARLGVDGVRLCKILDTELELKLI